MPSDTLADEPDAAALRESDEDAILEAKAEHGQTVLVIDPARLVSSCGFLKQERGYARLSSVTAVDWYPAEPRFEVVYHLHSLRGNRRLRLKCRVSGDHPEIDSVTGVWAGANWYEREVFDLFGIGFRSHPNLKRIMMPEDWDGHPLRKDYPVHGHKYDYKEEA